MSFLSICSVEFIFKGPATCFCNCCNKNNYWVSLKNIMFLRRAQNLLSWKKTQPPHNDATGSTRTCPSIKCWLTFWIVAAKQFSFLCNATESSRWSWKLQWCAKLQRKSNYATASKLPDKDLCLPTASFQILPPSLILIHTMLFACYIMFK